MSNDVILRHISHKCLGEPNVCGVSVLCQLYDSLNGVEIFGPNGDENGVRIGQRGGAKQRPCPHDESVGVVAILNKLFRL